MGFLRRKTEVFPIPRIHLKIMEQICWTKALLESLRLFSEEMEEQIMRYKYILVLLILLFGETCFAASFEDGLTHFGNGDFTSAYKVWAPLAEAGDSSAQYYVGQMLFQGKGITRNVKMAYVWLTLSSKGGMDMASDLLQDVKQEMNEAQIAEANLLANNYSRPNN